MMTPPRAAAAVGVEQVVVGFGAAGEDPIMGQAVTVGSVVGAEVATHDPDFSGEEVIEEGVLEDARARGSSWVIAAVPVEARTEVGLHRLCRRRGTVGGVTGGGRSTQVRLTDRATRVKLGLLSRRPAVARTRRGSLACRNVRRGVAIATSRRTTARSRQVLLNCGPGR